MSKGLEALDYFIALGQTCLMQSRNYKNNEVVVLKNGEKHTTKELGDIVVTALKRIPELEFTNSEQFKEKWVQDNLAMTFELNVANDKLKALEIIKNKKVNVGLLPRCATVERYNKGICYEPRQLTQEEYDLLKEILL